VPIGHSPPGVSPSVVLVSHRPSGILVPTAPSPGFTFQKSRNISRPPIAFPSTVAIVSAIASRHGIQQSISDGVETFIEFGLTVGILQFLHLAQGLRAQ
jgi:hypothetical protein